MIDKRHLEFLTAWGEEFVGALGFVDGLEGVTPHDAYEAFRSAFREEPSPRLLAKLTRSNLEQLRAATERRLENPVPLDRIQEAVARTLVRWPADEA